MTGDLLTALRTAHSGLRAQQQAIDAVAQNVANVNTPGFTRRTVNFEPVVLAGDGRGVQFGEISRTVDAGLIRSLRLELSALNAVSVQDTFDTRIQDVFGSPESNSALPHKLADLQAALDSLAATPESGLDQREVVRRAEEVAASLRQTSAVIQDLRSEADRRIAEAVNELSALALQVAQYNDKITRATELGQGTSELRDARDVALNRMAELVDIRVFERARGDVVVFTSAGQTIVDDTGATMSHVPASAVTAAVSYAAGGFDPILLTTGASSTDITAKITGGELGGLIDLRDRRLSDMQSGLDQLAAQFGAAINDAHNRGTAFPAPRELNGSRTFVTPTTETITYQGTSDTALVLFDDLGRQVAQTTVRTLLGVPPANAQGTVAEIAAGINAWLTAGGYGEATLTDGRLSIRITRPGLGLGIRDQAETVAGSAARDAVLVHAVDAGDGGGVTRTIGTATGFSRFFGLNDLFVGTGGAPTLYRSDVVIGGFAATTADLRVVDQAGVVGSVSIAAGDTLEQIALKLSSIDGITASVIPDGGARRLSVTADDGRRFVLVDNTASGDRLLADLGLRQADGGAAATIAVRADLSWAPSLLARGAVQWDPNAGLSGTYRLSVGDNTVIRDVAAAAAGPIGFATSGGIPRVTVTTTAYAATIISDHAATATAKRAEASFEKGLVSSLRHKADSISGVNLDQELADLMLFEQAYSAAARVISVVQSMFDALESAVG